MRHCICDPIPEIFDTAKYLDAAVSAHLSGHRDLAAKLFLSANCAKTRTWLDSIWGARSPHVVVRKVSALPIDVAAREPVRMPAATLVRQLHERDGYHCRYCGIPVIRPAIRKLACEFYPDEVTWGRTNATQHAGFQALWAQYDHVVPHSYGGTNDIANLVVSCAACNFGKMSFSLDQIGLSDPRKRPPVQSHWDGLERLKNGLRQR